VTVVDTRGSVPRAAGSLGRANTARGTGVALALVLAGAICGVGITWAALAGSATDRQTPLAFVVAAVAAACVARTSALKGVLIGLPLVWVGAAVVAGIVQSKQQTGGFRLTDVGTAVLSVTVLQAPWLWLGVALAAVIAFARGAFKRP
jgi:hypothetical protein